MPRKANICEMCDFDANEGVEATPQQLTTQWPVLKSPMWKMWLCEICFELKGVTLGEKRKINKIVKAVVVDRWNKGLYTELDDKILEKSKRPKDR